jgi:hypothetical protein
MRAVDPSIIIINNSRIMGPRTSYESQHANFYDDAPSDSETEAEAPDPAPEHPMSSMQGAFEESIVESTLEETKEESNQHALENADPRARHQKMLEDGDKRPKWRAKPGAKFHPFWKLAAQISFGVHLLQQQLAKSDEEVVKILQTHVDEIDAFLERTTEDFDLAIADVNERINYLTLPLQHLDVFNVMLDDRKFRASITEGNEKIERIIQRTKRAMQDALYDVEKGIEAATELGRYLDMIGSAWAMDNNEHLGIYTAMRGNNEGWQRCFRTLQGKSNDLAVVLGQLQGILDEMSKRVAIASKKSLVCTTAHRSC